MRSVRLNLKIFLFHYEQTGGSRNRQLPLNVLRRDPVTYYSINFQQHKDFYNFYDEKIVDSFFDSIHKRLVPGGSLKIQGYVELKNYQQTETAELENSMVWLTDVFIGC